MTQHINQRGTTMKRIILGIAALTLAAAGSVAFPGSADAAPLIQCVKSPCNPPLPSKPAPGVGGQVQCFTVPCFPGFPGKP